MPASSRDVEDPEVLPPEPHGSVTKAPEQSEVARILAKWLDELIGLPGTKFRIGLDPILGSIPGVGDLFTSSAGMVILLEGIRSRVSIFVLLRMGLNMLLNASMNLIPGVGAVGSAIFKSNSRNLALIKRWQEGHQDAVRRSSIATLVSLLIVLALIVGLWIALWVFYIWLILKVFGGLKSGA